MTESPLLELRDFSFAYRGSNRTAVDRVNLAVRSGEAVGLVGESGAGKTTLVLASLGLIDRRYGVCTGGSVYFKGQDITECPRRELETIGAREVAFVFQGTSALDPVLRAGNAVYESLRRQEGLPLEPSSKAAELMREVAGNEAAQWLSRYPCELSMGMRQRVMLAAALSLNRGLLIVDEPTSCLDQGAQQIVLNRLANRVEQHGFGVLVISHNLELIATLCSRAYVMKSARIIEEGAVESLIASPQKTYSQMLWRSAAEIRLNRRLPETRTRPGETAICLRGVSHAYHGSRNQTIDDVSLEIREGRSVGIVGPSGSGKTTLLRICLGLLRPTSFDALRFGGVALSSMTGVDWKRFRSQVQWIPQDPYDSLNPRRRVWKCVSEPLLAVQSLTRKGRRERAFSLIRQVGLASDVGWEYPARLSGGERQRVAIARALSVAPKVLICDEPVAYLDTPHKIRILNLLQSVREEFDLTLVVVSHDRSVVSSLCDEVIELLDGRIVGHRLVGSDTQFSQSASLLPVT